MESDDWSALEVTVDGVGVGVGEAVGLGEGLAEGEGEGVGVGDELEFPSPHPVRRRGIAMARRACLPQTEKCADHGKGFMGTDRILYHSR